MNFNDMLLRAKTALSYELFSVAGTPINLATIVMFLLIVLATYLLSRAARRGLRNFLDKRGVKDEGAVEIQLRLTHFLIMSIGVGVAIHTIGVNLSALFAAGALFAVGLGFAMQTIAQNFVAGIILMGERTIKPRDILQVEGQMVQVISMGNRAIVARTLDDEDLIVPNAILVQSTVKNYTLRDHLYRVRVTVGVVYSSDMRVVREAVQRAAESIETRSPDRDPVVLMSEFADSSVNFEASIWTTTPWATRTARSQLHEAIWWALKDEGITIAFPQLDVHLDPEVAKGIASLSSSS